MVELRQLRYFVAVAEELHFTRAAERLRMAQPPLSQQIRRLEAELNVRLFVRTKRKVELTGEGRVLLEGARRTIEEADRALYDVRRAASGEIGRLTVGFVGSATYALLPEVLRGYRERFPDVELVLRQITTAEQVELLNSGTIQVGFLRPPIDDPAIATETVSREPLLVALPDTHPLAARATIELHALAGEPFILFPRRLGQGVFDQIVHLCQAAGFSPRIEQEAVEMHTITGLVAAGLGVSLVPSSVQHLRSDGIVYRPIAGEQPTWEMAVAWQRHDQSSLTRGFVSIVRGE